MAVALVVVAAPVEAQTSMQDPVEWTWSADRPDSEAPLGVFGARTMDAGEVRIGYRFYQTNWRGVWFDRDSLDLATTLQPQYSSQSTPATALQPRHSSHDTPATTLQPHYRQHDWGSPPWIIVMPGKHERLQVLV